MKTRKKNLLLSLGLSAAVSASAFGDQTSKDREAILAHTGCFDVEFRFQETFPFEDNYVLADAHRSSIREWVEIVSDEPDRISLQHVLQAPSGEVIKHWRQVWEYQNDSLFAYQGKGLWKKVPLDPLKTTGQWTQKVYQVDDSPRYECSAPWWHRQDNPIWECQTFSPLPRRENHRQNEYDILDRRNRISMQADVWLHEQDNTKLQLRGDELRPIVAEKGLNTYQRLDDKACAKAQSWWSENRAAWIEIQKAWDQIYAEAEVIGISEGQSYQLMAALNNLAATWELDGIKENAYQVIRSVIDVE